MKTVFARPTPFTPLSEESADTQGEHPAATTALAAKDAMIVPRKIKTKSTSNDFLRRHFLRHYYCWQHHPDSHGISAGQNQPTSYKPNQTSWAILSNIFASQTGCPSRKNAGAVHENTWSRFTPLRDAGGVQPKHTYFTSIHPHARWRYSFEYWKTQPPPPPDYPTRPEPLLRYFKHTRTIRMESTRTGKMENLLRSLNLGGVAQ